MQRHWATAVLTLAVFETLSLGCSGRTTGRQPPAVETQGGSFSLALCGYDQSEQHSVASLPTGGFAIAWLCQGSLFVQVFGKDHTPSAPHATATPSAADPDTAGNGTSEATFGAPHVTSLQGGSSGETSPAGFLVVWEQSGAAEGLWGQIYQATGDPLGSSLLISPDVNSSRRELASAGCLPDGSVVVSWLDTACTAIHCRVLTPTTRGAPAPNASPPALVHRLGGGDGADTSESPPSRCITAHAISSIGDGSFALAWGEALVSDTTAATVHTLVFSVSTAGGGDSLQRSTNADASTPPRETRVAIRTPPQEIGAGEGESHVSPRVSGGCIAGRYAVVWEARSRSSGRATYLHVARGGGAAPLLLPLHDPHSSLRWLPNIGLLDDCTWVVMWNQLGWSPAGIRAYPAVGGELVAASGERRGDAFEVPTAPGLEGGNTPGGDSAPGIAPLPGARFVVTWQRRGKSSSELLGQELAPFCAPDEARWSPYALLVVLAVLGVALLCVVSGCTSRIGVGCGGAGGAARAMQKNPFSSVMPATPGGVSTPESLRGPPCLGSDAVAISVEEGVVQEQRGGDEGVRRGPVVVAEVPPPELLHPDRCVSAGGGGGGGGGVAHAVIGLRRSSSGLSLDQLGTDAEELETF